MSLKSLDHVNFITKDMSATIEFYTKIIGLIHGPSLPGALSGMEYFYIPGQPHSVLHVGDATIERQSTRFKQYAKIPVNTEEPATGVLDHFCLTCDLTDYEAMIDKLKQHHLDYQTYCAPDGHIKQIWLLDPNRIRVELTFIL